jgi:hypothetical protein
MLLLASASPVMENGMEDRSPVATTEDAEDAEGQSRIATGSFLRVLRVLCGGALILNFYASRFNNAWALRNHGRSTRRR